MTVTVDTVVKCSTDILEYQMYNVLSRVWPIHHHSEHTLILLHSNTKLNIVYSKHS